MRIAFTPIDGISGTTVNITMPTAYNSGHSVTMRDGDSLQADVRLWFKYTAFDPW